MDATVDLEGVSAELVPILPRVASRDAAVHDAIRGDGEIAVRARRLNDVELPAACVEARDVVVVHEIVALEG